MRLRLAAKARNINNPNAKIAITPTVIEDIVATKQRNELIKCVISSKIIIIHIKIIINHNNHNNLLPILGSLTDRAEVSTTVA